MPRLLRSLRLLVLTFPIALALQSCCEMGCQLAYEATTRHCDDDCGDDQHCLSECRGPALADRAGCENECALAR